MSIKKILIVGSGSAGERHYAYATKKFPNSKVYCLGKNREPKFAENRFTDYSEAKKFSADLIIIANASVDHLLALQSLLSETALYVIEKPFSSGPIDNEILRKLSGVLGKRVLLAYQLRFSQSLTRLKKELNLGLVGRVLFGTIHTGQYLPDWRNSKDYHNSVSARRELGGGVLNELSHEIDLIFWLFGPPMLRNSQVYKRSSLQLNVEDFIQIDTLQSNPKFPDNWPLNVRLEMIRRDPMRIAEIVGENGTLRWDGILGTLNYFDPASRSWILLSKDSSHPHDLLWENIADFVKVGYHFGANLEDGIRVIDFIDKIWQSQDFRIEGL